MDEFRNELLHLLVTVRPSSCEHLRASNCYRNVSSLITSHVDQFSINMYHGAIGITVARGATGPGQIILAKFTRVRA